MRRLGTARSQAVQDQKATMIWNFYATVNGGIKKNTSCRNDLPSVVEQGGGTISDAVSLNHAYYCDGIKSVATIVRI